MKGNVKLRSCLVDGETRRVSDFAHLPAKDRPIAVCPECKNPLVFRLGNIKSHHAAHKAENRSCSLTTAEGILHFNTKKYIYEQLKQGNKLFIRQICSGWDGTRFRGCLFLYPASRPFLWLEDWDDIQLERNIRSLRPDIILYRNKKPIAAIEVCVTHAINEEKKAKFLEIGLPWIEVKAAGEEIDEYFVDWADGYEEDDIPWKIEKPLIYDNCHPQPESWVCDDCVKAPERYAELLKKRSEEEALRKAHEQLKKIAVEQEIIRKQRRYLKDQDNRILFARAVMLLKPLCNTDLLELFVVERRNSDPPYAPEELYLRMGRTADNILISEEPITENSRQAINEFARNLIRLKKMSYEVLMLTKWLPLAEYEKQIENYTLSKKNE